MMNDKLTMFEKYAIEKDSYEFNYTFELVLFVIKLNEYVIKYYEDNIYSYILRKKLERKKGRKLLDDEFDDLISHNNFGLVLFPSYKFNQLDNEYVKYLMNNLLSFVQKVNYQDLKYANIIKMSKEKKLESFIRYKDCIESAKDMRKLEKYKIDEFVVSMEQEIKRSDFDFLYELHSFIQRLNNYYISTNDIDKIEKLKVIKKDIKPLD